MSAHRNFEDTPEFRLGQWGEELVAAQMEAVGFLVDRTANRQPRDGKGPRLAGRESTPVLPDLRGVWRGRVHLWVEVKTKSHAELGRITNKLEHCVDLISWNAVRDYQVAVGEPVFLAVVEANTAAIIMRHIDQLKPRKDSPRPIHGQPCMFFTREQFKEDGISYLVRCAERMLQRRPDAGDTAQGEL